MGNVCPAVSRLIGAKQVSGRVSACTHVRVPDWAGLVGLGCVSGRLGEFNSRSAELCLCLRLVPGDREASSALSHWAAMVRRGGRWPHLAELACEWFTAAVCRPMGSHRGTPTVTERVRVNC